MKTYKDFLLVSDLDGTLLNSEKIVSTANKVAINEFVARGGQFAIATGRTPDNARGYLRGITVNSPSIFYNGSLLVDLPSGKILKSCPLNGILWRQFAAYCLKKFPQVCLEIYTADRLYILSEPCYDDPRLTIEKWDYQHISLAEAADLEWLKFFLCAPRPILEQIRSAAANLKITEVSTNFYSEVNYLEFVGAEVSKGHMMEVMRKLPVNAGRLVVAAGDYPNDNELLQRADCGVAPANAVAETKQCANRVGPDCNHDLWRYIIREVLPSL